MEGEDGGVALGSVGVALDGNVEDAEAGLVGMANFAGQEDGGGAGAEDWFFFCEGLESIEEAGAVEKFEHGGGFAAGKDEAIEGLAVQAKLFRRFHEGRPSAGLFEGCGMAFVVALNGQDADVWGISTCQCFSCVRRVLLVGIVPSY